MCIFRDSYTSVRKASLHRSSELESNYKSNIINLKFLAKAK